jgi:hypothetical protein
LLNSYCLHTVSSTQFNHPPAGHATFKKSTTPINKTSKAHLTSLQTTPLTSEDLTLPPPATQNTPTTAYSKPLKIKNYYINPPPSNFFNNHFKP